MMVALYPGTKCNGFSWTMATWVNEVNLWYLLTPQKQCTQFDQKINLFLLNSYQAVFTIPFSRTLTQMKSYSMKNPNKATLRTPSKSQIYKNDKNQVNSNKPCNSHFCYVLNMICNMKIQNIKELISAMFD